MDYCMKCIVLYLYYIFQVHLFNLFSIDYKSALIFEINSKELTLL